MSALLAWLHPVWVLLGLVGVLTDCGGPAQEPVASPPAPVPELPEPRIAGKPLFVLQTGHGSVTSVAFSPDGRTIAVGGGKIVRLWDASTGTLRAALRGHAKLVTSVAFSPDGQTIASGGVALRLWDAATGALRATLDENDANTFVTSVVFSPDGHTIATGSSDKTVRFWDAQTGALMATLENDASTFVTSVAFSPDGHTIAAGDAAGTVRLWNVEIGTLDATLQGHAKRVTSVAFSPDGQTIASASVDKTVRLWNAKARALTATLRGHASVVSSVAFSPDGGVIASASPDKTLRLWNAETGTLTATLEGHAEWIRSVAFSPDGRTIASGDATGTVRLWNAETGALSAILRGHWFGIRSVAFSPDGQTIASGAFNGTVRLWNAATGAPSATLVGHTDFVNSVAFSPDGKSIASGAGKSGFIWNAKTGAPRATLQGPVSGAAFSPDGHTIASGWLGTLRLWDAETAALTATLRGHHWFGISSVAFSPDGHTLASGGGRTVGLWDATAGVLRATLEGHASSVTSVAVSPDGHTVASASADKTVRLWSAETGALTATLEGHTDSVNSVAFSPDGEGIASGSDDNTVRLWDAVTTVQTAVLAGHADGVESVAFSPNGKIVVSGGPAGIMLHRVADGLGAHLTAFTTHRGKRYLVHTADGLFTGDEDVFDRVMFRVGSDLRTADMLTADQLFESFHRPSLMQDFLAGRPIEPLPEVREGIGLPPSVQFVEVPEGAVTTERMRVKVRANDRGGGISDIRVFVNGARPATERGVQLTQQAPGIVAYEKEAELFLVPGENVITAEAYNVLGHIRGPRARHEVTLNAPAVARPRLHLLAVTLSQYADPSMKLGYANNDGDALVEAFERQKGRLFEEVVVDRLRDADATLEGIEHAIDRIAGRARPADVFVMFASGHGGMVKCPGEGKAGYRLVTHRATLRSERLLCAEALSVNRLAQKLRKIAASKKLLILDTCQAGGASTGETLLAMRGAEEVDTIKRLARAEGLAILSAASAREQAYELKSLSHGLFTYTLLRGLDGGAAFRGERHISVFGLLHYVDKHLPTFAQRHMGRQQVPIYSTQGQDFPIFALNEGDAPLVKSPLAHPSGTRPPTGLHDEAKWKIRTHIDARSEAVLGCVDASTLVVRATVAADGTVTFAPRSSKISDQDADCVGIALGQLRVEAGGISGEVVHPIQGP